MSRCSFSHTAKVDQPGQRAFDEETRNYIYIHIH